MGFNYDRDISNNLRAFLTGQIRTESDRRTSTQAQLLGTDTPVTFDVQDGNTKINMRAGIGTIDETFTVELWGNNLTDVNTRGVTFNTVLRGGSRSAFLQEPRTYGVTVRTQF
jgi:hypothetical protein